VAPDTKAMVVNATYLRAYWDEPFDQKKTIPGIFYSPQGPITAQMMIRSGRFPYGKRGETQYITVPFRNAVGAMHIVLAEEGTSPQTALRAWVNQGGTDALLSLPANQGTIRLPRFRLDFQIDLSQQLKAQGMARLFDGTGDFSALVTSPQRMAMGGILHRATVTVDEAGATAAAATAIPLFGAAPTERDSFDMNVDRPFLFAITGARGELVMLGFVTVPL
jgi:serpin B